MNFTLKIFKNNRTIQRVQTHSIRRFHNRLRTINWKERGLKVYLRVSYGRHKDVFGKKITFYNEGFYENKDDLWNTLEAFRSEK